MTMANLAAAVQCSESFISKIEAGKASPSLNMLHRISQVLATNIGELFSPINDLDGVILRQGKRPIIEHTLRKGRQISLERLLTPDKDNLLQAFLHHLEPDAASEGLIVHAGEEFGYVLEGSIELTVGKQQYVLNSGDTFHFPSEQPHGYRNVGSGVAKILWVNTPPTY
jgi:mannose-6-phosphate isomerase-like protein (cupin superfamily)/DNA-binding XRE family transcriptional regulator